MPDHTSITIKYEFFYVDSWDYNLTNNEDDNVVFSIDANVIETFRKYEVDPDPVECGRSNNSHPD